jgi:hypothetical protein
MFWFKKKEPETKTKITHDVIFTIHMKNGKILTKTYKHTFSTIWYGVDNPQSWKFKRDSKRALFRADDNLMYVYNDIDFVETKIIYFEVTYIPGYIGLSFDEPWKFISEEQIEVET